jgi:NADH-quinone oxidoreductase subunit K
LRGHILVFFVITVAAAEAAIGLAIILALFRNKQTAHVDEMNEMKG